LCTGAWQICPVDDSSRALNCSPAWSSVRPSRSAREKLAMRAGSGWPRGDGGGERGSHGRPRVRRRQAASRKRAPAGPHGRTLRRRGRSPAWVPGKNLNTERGKSPPSPAAPGACPPRQKPGHPSQERQMRARASTRYAPPGSRAIWPPRHARTNTLPRRRLVCEPAGCRPVHRT